LGINKIFMTTQPPSTETETEFDAFVKRLNVVRPTNMTEEETRAILLEKGIPALRQIVAMDPALLKNSAFMTRAQYNEELTTWLHQQRDAARDTWIDGIVIPPQLPYNPIPTGLGVQIPWLCEQQVRSFSARLQIPPYNYPNNTGALNPTDYCDASNKPFNTLFQYQNQGMPTLKLTKIVISALVDMDRAPLVYPFNLNLESAFFSDPPAPGNEVQWYIEYMNYSKIKYTTPPEPDTYPANLLLRWVSAFRLTGAASSMHHTDAVAVMDNVSTNYVDSPFNDVSYHWTFDTPGGVYLKNGDMIQMRTGLPTVDSEGRNYLKKCYVTCYFELAHDWDRYNALQASKKQFITAIITIP
jgi:hypothetical protein